MRPDDLPVAGWFGVDSVPDNARSLLCAGRAKDLRNKADRPFGRFHDAFWDEASGFYAYALDGEKNQVLTVASNPGHCLWSGIVPPERAARVVARLMAPDMWSGWGIRTLSADHVAFNPYAHQLRTNFPVQYLGANVPQAWAAGSAFMLLQAVLGLALDGARNKVFIDPVLPAWLPDITIKDLTLGAQRFSMRFWRDGEETRHQVLSGEPGMVVRRAFGAACDPSDG